PCVPRQKAVHMTAAAAMLRAQKSLQSGGHPHMTALDYSVVRKAGGTMARFKVVTPTGTSYGMSLSNSYEYENEALTPLDAEIVEIDATSENSFIAAAHDADAVYAKGRFFTKRMIDGLERCKIIALGSVGVDQVDVAAATAHGIPVTNVPDTFIEEVADHAMMLILATFRRLTTMDRMVRDGRWKEGRPLVSRFPRLMGETLGVVAVVRVCLAEGT